MVKYESKLISTKDLKVETDRCWNSQDEKVEVVKLTMISTGLEITYASKKGQLHTYNEALKLLEKKYLEWRDEYENR